MVNPQRRVFLEMSQIKVWEIKPHSSKSTEAKQLMTDGHSCKTVMTFAITESVVLKHSFDYKQL